MVLIFQHNSSSNSTLFRENSLSTQLYAYFEAFFHVKSLFRLRSLDVLKDTKTFKMQTHFLIQKKVALWKKYLTQFCDVFVWKKWLHWMHCIGVLKMEH